MPPNVKRLGIAADHGGFVLKAELSESLRTAGFEIEDYGAYELDPGDDYPDFIIPLARAVASAQLERGVALCGSGVGASVATNKIPGVRAGLIHECSPPVRASKTMTWNCLEHHAAALPDSTRGDALVDHRSTYRTFTDITLTSHGEQEARGLAPGLRAIQFTRILTSPLLRARQTSELAGFGAAGEIEPDLVEWNYGDYEGKRTVDIQEARPGWNIWRDGCPHGETPANVVLHN